MATSRREKCLARFHAVLAGIVAGNPAGKPGTFYANTFPLVKRWTAQGPDLGTAANVPAVSLAAVREQKTDGPLEQIRCTLDVEVAVFIRHDEAAETRSTDAFLTDLVRDIELAILNNRRLVDPSSGEELCEDIEVRGGEMFPVEPGEPYAGYVMDIAIKYRHSNIDPDYVV